MDLNDSQQSRQINLCRGLKKLYGIVYKKLYGLFIRKGIYLIDLRCYIFGAIIKLRVVRYGMIIVVWNL